MQLENTRKTGNRFGHLLGVLCGAGLLMASSASAVPAVWTGSGSYATPGNWDIATVPCNLAPPDYDVTIPASSGAVDIDLACAVDSLSLGSFSLLNGLAGADFDAPIATIDNAQLSASAGATITVGASNYASTSRFDSFVVFSATGAGSLLDLPSMTELNARFDDADAAVHIHTVTASDGAVIDLSSVEKLRTPVQVEDALDFTATTGGLISFNPTGRTQVVNAPVMFDAVGNARFTATDSTFEFGTFIPMKSTRIEATSSVIDVAGDLQLFCNGSVIDIFADFGDSTLVLDGSFSFNETVESEVEMSDSIVAFSSAGTHRQRLEVGGLDVGLAVGTLTDTNFGIGQLVVGESGQATVVRLVDEKDNGNGPPEALYLYGLDPLNAMPDGLIIQGGSTLLLDGLNVYVFEDDQDAVGVHLNSLFPGGGADPNVIAYGGGFIQLLPSTCDPAMDSDGDGWCDNNDNCIDKPNPDQRDPDRDGNGSDCDADLDQDGVVAGSDFNVILKAFGTGKCSEDFVPGADMDMPGLVNATNFNILLQAFGDVPGPSGLACAGTIPCLGVDLQ